MPTSAMNARAPWVITLTAVVLFVVGFVLSRRVEPGIRIDSVTLADATPAIRFLPLTAGSHPVALLAHGITASKESLFRYCEALAAAGFVCFTIDLPGHGESPLPFGEKENARAIAAVSRALGTVDVFLGHSMGAYAGAESVRNGHLHPKLFVAVGALPDFGPQHPPLLLLTGRFDEHVPDTLVRAYGSAQLVVSPWSNHVLELYDPVLIRAAIGTAGAAVGKTAVGSPGQWRWRFLGVGLAVLSALLIGINLPELFPCLAWARGPLIVLAVIGAIVLTGSTWFGTVPVARRIPWQLGTALFLAPVFVGIGRMNIPRWSFVALAATGVLLCLVAQATFLAFILAILVLVLFIGTVLAWIAARRGTRRDGDIALAIFIGYVIGQWNLWTLGSLLAGQ